MVLAFISFPLRFTAALWRAPLQKNLEETLASQACTGAALCTTDLVFEKMERNTAQTRIYLSMCKVRVKVANVAAGSSVWGGRKIQATMHFSAFMLDDLSDGVNPGKIQHNGVHKGHPWGQFGEPSSMLVIFSLPCPGQPSPPSYYGGVTLQGPLAQTGVWKSQTCPNACLSVRTQV